MAEVLPFVVVLYLLTQHFGLPGAAVAFTMRVTIDNLLLSHLSGLTRTMLTPTLLGIVAICATGYLANAEYAGAFRIGGALGILLITVFISVWLMPKGYTARLLSIVTGSRR